MTLKHFSLFCMFVSFSWGALHDDATSEGRPQAISRDPSTGLFFWDDGRQSALDVGSLRDLNRAEEHDLGFVMTGKAFGSGAALAEGTDLSGEDDLGFSSVAGGNSTGPLKPQGYEIGESVARQSHETYFHNPHFIIENPAKYPHSAVVNLGLKLCDETGATLRRYLGSGVLIRSGVGPSVVLTAAHNLYYRGLGTGPSEISIFPGLSSDAKPFETVAKKFIVHKQYVKADKGYENFDLGLIVLEDDLGLAAAAGELTISHKLPDAVKAGSISILGYPALVPSHTETAGEADTLTYDVVGGEAQYQMTGDNIRFVPADAPRAMYYDINTQGGLSGAPVVMQSEDGTFSVVGIHGYGGSQEEGNRGVYLNGELQALIHRWITEFASKP